MAVPAKPASLGAPGATSLPTCGAYLRPLKARLKWLEAGLVLLDPFWPPKIVLGFFYGNLNQAINHALSALEQEAITYGRQ